MAVARKLRKFIGVAAVLLLLTLLGYGELKYNLERDEKGMNGRLRFTTSFDVSVGVQRIPDEVEASQTATVMAKVGPTPTADELLRSMVNDFDQDNVPVEVEDVSSIEQGPTKTHNDTLFTPSLNRIKNRLTLILHTGAAYYQDRLRSQLDTWLSPKTMPKGFNLLIYTTDPIIPGMEKIMYQVNNLQKDTGEDEGFVAMNERVLQSFQHAFKMFDSDYYMKIDDDTYVNLTTLDTFLSMADGMSTIPAGTIITSQSSSQKTLKDDVSNMYDNRVQFQMEKVKKYNDTWHDALPGGGRYFGDCSCISKTQKVPVPHLGTQRKWRWKYACGGPGYILDRKAMHKIVDYEQRWTCHRVVEDVTVGLCMDYVGVSCTHVDGFVNYERMGSVKQRGVFHVKPWKFASLLHGAISIHKTLPDNMYRVYQILTGLRNSPSSESLEKLL